MSQSKHMFEPVKYKSAGKFLLILGFSLIIINALDYVFQWDVLSPGVYIIGIALVALGLYVHKIPK